MKKLFLTLLILPVMVLAQTEEELVVGEVLVQYDSKSETENVTYYYQGESLVASEYEKITLVFENDSLVLEAHDIDGDGEKDVFLTIDNKGEIESVTGEASEFFQRPEPDEFAKLIGRDDVVGEASAQKDLVGSLDSISIPKYHNYVLYVFILFLLVGGYWWYRKNS